MLVTVRKGTNCEPKTFSEIAHRLLRRRVGIPPGPRRQAARGQGHPRPHLRAAGSEPPVQPEQHGGHRRDRHRRHRCWRGRRERHQRAVRRQPHRPEPVPNRTAVAGDVHGLVLPARPREDPRPGRNGPGALGHQGQGARPSRPPDPRRNPPRLLRVLRHRWRSRVPGAFPWAKRPRRPSRPAIAPSAWAPATFRRGAGAASTTPANRWSGLPPTARKSAKPSAPTPTGASTSTSASTSPTPCVAAACSKSTRPTSSRIPSATNTPSRIFRSCECSPPARSPTARSGASAGTSTSWSRTTTSTSSAPLCPMSAASPR